VVRVGTRLTRYPISRLGQLWVVMDGRILAQGEGGWQPAHGGGRMAIQCQSYLFGPFIVTFCPLITKYLCPQ
jgi:hypothetical protein